MSALRRLVAATAALLCVLGGSLALAGAPALAAHVFSGSFGASGSGPGQFSGPSGVAVNEETGDVYVVDKGNNRVQEFNATGSAVLGEFNGAASPTGAFSGPEGVAVDNSANPLDPSKGDVYVVDAGHEVVDKFSAAGVYEGQLKGAEGAAFLELEGVGVDPAGVVWVYQRNSRGRGEIFSYGDGLGNEFLSKITEPESVAIGAGLGFAVDAEDNVYVHSGLSFFAKFNRSGDLLIEAVDGEESTGAAVDQFSDDVYIDNVGSVAEFNPAGELLERFGEGHLTAGSGVAVDPVTGVTYVADSTANVVAMFTGPVFPGVSTDKATNLDVEGGATLHGAVSPRGVPVTACAFEYVSDAVLKEFVGLDFEELLQAGFPAEVIFESLGIAASCEHPSAAEIDGAAKAPVAVHANVSGLTPETVYHFRLLAGNANGSEGGRTQSFFAAAHPRIGGEAATGIVSGSATLNAVVNPEGLEATYRFEYGTSTAYGASAPVPAGDIATRESGVPVSVHVTGLSANTTYHWRVVASNAIGATTTADHTFIYDTSGAGLPDNRAYEMVTPPQKNGALIGFGLVSPFSIAEDGSRVVLSTIQCFGGTESCNANRQIQGEPFAFTRTSGGWLTSALAPPAARLDQNTPLAASASADTALFNSPTPPSGEDDLYARQPDGSFLDIGPMTLPSQGPDTDPFRQLQGVQATADFSRVVYTLAFSSLWPFDATNVGTGIQSLYEYAGSGNAQPFLVGVSGGAGSTDLIGKCATQLGGPDTAYDALSADGGTVYFTVEPCASGSGANAGTPVPARQLYARIDESRTVAISAHAPQPQCEAACQSSPARDALFQGASADGSRVFFTSEQRLTDSASQDSGSNLYLYDSPQENPLSGDHLVDVSAGDTSGGGPRVQSVMAVSSDGSHVYFVANGVLSGVANSQGQTATDGAENLYVYERDASYPDGRVSFIAALPHHGSGGVGPGAPFGERDARWALSGVHEPRCVDGG